MSPAILPATPAADASAAPELGDPLPVGVPRHLRLGQVELVCVEARHLETPVAERCERSRGTPELGREAVAADPLEAVEGIHQRDQPDGALQPERRRHGVLEERPPGHRRRSVRARKLRAAGGGRVEPAADESERPLRDEHRGRVHDVLARGPPVDEAGRLPADRRDAARERAARRGSRRRGPPRRARQRRRAPGGSGRRSRRRHGPGSLRRSPPRSRARAPPRASPRARPCPTRRRAGRRAPAWPGSRSQGEERRLPVTLQADVEPQAVAVPVRDERRRARRDRAPSSTGSAAFARSSSGKYMRVSTGFSRPRAKTSIARCGASPPGRRHPACA